MYVVSLRSSYWTTSVTAAEAAAASYQIEKPLWRVGDTAKSKRPRIALAHSIAMPTSLRRSDVRGRLSAFDMFMCVSVLLQYVFLSAWTKPGCV